MKRRRFLRRASAGVAGLTMLAGCTATDGGGGNSDSSGSEATNTSGATTGKTGSAAPSGTLTIATYSSFTGEGTAGNWLKSAFESEYPEVTIEFTIPQNGVNQYVQRAKQGAPIDTDLYVGLNTAELVRVTRNLDGSLFRPVDDRLDRTDTIKQALKIDPKGRAIPYDTGYISLVYNSEKVKNPGTFDALLKSRYAGDLITENAQQSDPGRAFLLWSIIAKGENNYLDYWEQLLDNGVKVLSDWETAYQAYMDGAAPMVVSYSTDQVYYHGPDVDISKHQIGFLNNQGYANPETMALFEKAENPELGRRFMDFVLRKDVQAEIAVRNVQFPAVKGVVPSEEFAKYAKEPPEAVTFTYDELAGSVETWVEEWARLVASA